MLLRLVSLRVLQISAETVSSGTVVCCCKQMNRHDMGLYDEVL
jgi:hypothetical protein